MLDLADQRFVANLVPALIELALVLGDPLLRHMVRRVRGARREVGEERLIRRDRLLEVGPFDRLVGQVGHRSHSCKSSEARDADWHRRVVVPEGAR